MILINIGDELLLGQVINTNAAFIGKKMAFSGSEMTEYIAIGDDKKQIIETLDYSLSKTDVVIITGGLGPTKDDITKKVICEYFNRKLVEDEETLQWVTEIFAARGVALTETNRKQAEVPEGAVVLKNTMGTAPGIWIEEGNKTVVMLPGVPYEMEKLINEEIIPRLEKKYHNNYVNYKVLQCTGISESDLSDKLENFENQLPENLKLAYLPEPGIIRLRLTVHGDDNSVDEILDKQFENLKNEVGNLAFTDKDQSLEEVIGELLKNSGKKIATAESCTGGNIAHLITSVPGSSEYFNGGVVAYNNFIKRDILNVREDNLKKHGAVSEPVVSDMALNIMDLFDTDYAVATSGIAGPCGGSEEKPVGTVWIAVATPTRLITQKFNFGKLSGRAQIIKRASNAALNMLRIEIEKDVRK